MSDIYIYIFVINDRINNKWPIFVNGRIINLSEENQQFSECISSIGLFNEYSVQDYFYRILSIIGIA